MAFSEPGRADSTASHSSNREIETIVEEFTGEVSPGARTPTSAESDRSPLTPRAKSSLAKKLAKSLGFSSNSQASSSECKTTKSFGDGDRAAVPSDLKQNSDRNVRFGGASQNAAMQESTWSTTTKSTAVMSVNSGSAGPSQTATFVSPFQRAQEAAVRGESSLFYSPPTSFVSAISSKPSKAMSSTLEEEASQARKSPLGLANPATRSGELEMRKGKLALLDPLCGEERTTSGSLAAKSRRSSLTYSVKSSGMMLQFHCCYPCAA